MITKRKKSFRGGKRRPGSLVIAIFAVGIVGLSVATAVSGSDSHEPSDEPGVSTSAASDDHAACREKAARCEVLTVAGTTFEYAVMEPSGQSKGIVLVESGGPGLDTFTRRSFALTGLPKALAESHTLLVLREPWTLDQISPNCRSDVAALVAGASRISNDEPRSWTCATTSWTRDTYIAALNAALARESAPLVGIIGQSFGVLPAVAATAVASNAWLVINAPIARPETPGPRVLNDRIAALSASLNASYAKNCGQLGLECSSTGSNIIGDALARGREVTSSERSRPLTVGEVALAVIGASYDLEANEGWLWSVLAKYPNELGASDAENLGRLADQLTRRAGDDGAVDYSMAAYVNGLCRTYPAWSGAISPDILGALFRAISRVCVRTADQPRLGYGASPDSKWHGRACILVNEDDPVAPGSWARDWLSVVPRETHVKLHYRGHLDLIMASERTKIGGCLPWQQPSK